jgi:hypothetical protein
LRPIAVAVPDVSGPDRDPTPTPVEPDGIADRTEPVEERVA